MSLWLSRDLNWRLPSSQTSLLHCSVTSANIALVFTTLYYAKPGTILSITLALFIKHIVILLILHVWGCFNCYL